MRTLVTFAGAVDVSKRVDRWPLGTTYGLSLVVNTIQSAVGLAAADGLFAFSLMHSVLGGKVAYVVLLGVVCVCWVCLPIFRRTPGTS